jgi:hypothetical protein
MLQVTVGRQRVRIGARFSVSFQRTLRIPDDGRVYPLPPGLEAFPIRRVQDYSDRVPARWREHGGVFIPMYQREALWLGFDGALWKPNAVKIGVGKINAVSGGPWDVQLHGEPQDYLVCPDQPWLDGINAGSGVIRQFIAMPLGLGYTVEAQVTGAEEFGGIQILVYEPRPGRFPDRPPPARQPGPRVLATAAPKGAGEMGLGAGGQMKQKIYPDPSGIDTWDPENSGEIFVHILNSEQYREVTGRKPPPTPVNARTYTEHGFPWFDLYDESRGDLSAPDRLAKIKSVQDLEAERGAPAAEETSVDVVESQIRKLRHGQTREGR